MAFDAGAISASLTVDTSKFDRDLDAAAAKVKALEDAKHEVKISAVFDTNSLSRARQQFAQLDQQISKDAMSRLRSNPQGSVLGALNALFSPHPVTGAPSASQAAQQGLLGKIVQAPGGGTAGPSGGQNVIQQVTGSGGGQSNANQRITQDVTTTDRVNTVGLPTNNAISTTDRVNVTGLPTSGGTITTTDKVQPDVDTNLLRARVAEAAKEAADDADTTLTEEAKRKGPGWFSGFLSGISGLFGSGGEGDKAASDAGTKAADSAANAAKKEAAKQSGGIIASLFGGGGSDASAGALDKGLVGGIGPGILGTSFKSASLIGLGGAALGAVPALAAGLAPLGLAGTGLGILSAGASSLIGQKNTKSNPNAQGPLYDQAQAAGKALQDMVQNAASGLITPLKNLFNQIPSLAKQVTPALSQVFSGTAALIQPTVKGLVSAIQAIGPGLSAAFKATGPLLQPLITGIGQLVGGLLPGLVSLLKAAGPAVSVVSGFFASLGSNLGTMFRQFSTVIGPSSVILKALLDVVTGLLPVIGGLAQAMASALGPAFTAFAGAIKALEPFLVGVGKILAQFAGAVLQDLSGGLQLVASVLKAVSPAFNQLAGALGQVFNTLESKGGFAQLGNILEGLATPIGNLIKSLVSGLAPAIPPLLNLFGQLVNVVSSVGVQVLTALIPPLTNLAEIALGAIMKVLPQVIPLVTQFVSAFTADAGTLITQVGGALLNLATVVLTKLLQAAQPLIPAVLALLSAFTPLLNILTPVVATTITAIANALAAVVNAIPSGVLTAAIAGVAGVVGVMKLWGAAASGVATAMKAITGSSIASWLSGAVGGMRDFAAATEGASLAEKGLLAGEVALDAISPFAWIALGVAGIGALVLAFTSVNQQAQQITQTLTQQDQATGYNIAGYQKLASQLDTLGASYSKAGEQTRSFANAARGGGNDFAQVGQQLSAQSQAVITLATNMQTRLTALSQGLGVSKTTIEQWASATGISAQKFGGTSENVQKLTDQIAGYVNKNAEAVTSTASLGTNMAIFGNDVFSATTQLDAFNQIWNTLVGNLLTKQQAITQGQQSFDNLKQSIKDTGTTSDQSKQSFQTYIDQIGSSASALEKSGASVSQINSYLQTQINNLTSLGPLNKQQQADVDALRSFQDALANSTHGLNDAQLTYIQQVEAHVIPDLQQMGANTPKVTGDVNDLANSIAQTGTKSASTASDRAQLIHDLEQSGVSAQDATKFVDGLTSSLSKVPKSTAASVVVNASGLGGITITASGLPSTMNKEILLGSIARASGGLIGGNGAPKADDRIARVSSGEYVVQTSAVQKYGVGMMDAINAGRFASGGLVGALAGLVPTTVTDVDTDAAQGLQQDVTDAVQNLAAQVVAAATSALNPTGSGATIQALMKSMAASVGWTGAEWTALNNVEMREAGYSLTATNPSSGAYGLAQFINGPGEYAQYGGSSTTAQGQITGMLNYIKQRYGDPIAAWNNELQYGYYDRGGYLKPGYTLAFNGTGRPEPVISSSGGGASFDDIVSRLDRLIRATEQVPAGVGAHVGGAINGSAHDASFRSRYPRSSP